MSYIRQYYKQEQISISKLIGIPRVIIQNLFCPSATILSRKPQSLNTFMVPVPENK